MANPRDTLFAEIWRSAQRANGYHREQLLALGALQQHLVPNALVWGLFRHLQHTPLDEHAAFFDMSLEALAFLGRQHERPDLAALAQLLDSLHRTMLHPAIVTAIVFCELTFVVSLPQVSDATKIALVDHLVKVLGFDTELVDGQVTTLLAGREKRTAPARPDVTTSSSNSWTTFYERHHRPALPGGAT